MLDFNSDAENICTLNTQNLSPPLSLSLSTDDFFVDQLLNLNYDDHQLVEEDDHFHVTQTPPTTHLSPSHSHSPRFDFDFDFDPHLHDSAFVLSVPPAEEADLEWLSHFVEESFSQFSSPYPDGVKPNTEQPEFKPKPEPKPEPESPEVASFASLPALSRSRRSKRVSTGCREGGAALEEPSASSSGPSSPNPDPARKKRREVGPALGSGSGSGSPRRCSHCGAQKTPQWRIGPLGPKSLCNACGVRYKSGRLLPEYRPACSPTFSSELHSNSHMKVLEMRRNKEARISGRVKSGLSRPVQSFG